MSEAAVPNPPEPTPGPQLPVAPEQARSEPSPVAVTEPETSHPPAVDAATPETAPTPRVGYSWLNSLQSLATTVVIAVFVITFLVQAFQIPSESMENTLLIGDYLLVDKVHFAHGGVWSRVLPYEPIHRGDIIVFRYPVHPDQHFVKRVVGLPGDSVRLIDKHLLVNGRPAKEPYAIFQAHDTDIYRDDFPQPDLPSPSLDANWWDQMRSFVHGGELKVPPDRYFVLGDNRDFSLDSRYWGFVPRENIIGRPLVIYLSLRSWGEDDGPDGKLAGTGYLGQILHLPRWGRTFRIVQ
jgi:signal peptidase I